MTLLAPKNGRADNIANASGDVIDCTEVSNGILIVLDFKKEWYGWSEPNTGGNQ